MGRGKESLPRSVNETMRLSKLVLSLVMMAVGFTADPSAAYTGGPLIVELMGYEPMDGKVYYWLHDLSEASSPRRIFFFDLNSSNPTTPVHAASLDVPVDSVITGIGVRRFAAIRKRLRPLEELRDYEVRLSVRADSIGFDGRNKAVCYRLHADLRAGSAAQTMNANSVRTWFVTFITISAPRVGARPRAKATRNRGAKESGRSGEDRPRL